MKAWRRAVVGACLLAGAGLLAAAAGSPAEGVGEAIYLRGVLGSGALLEGTRKAGGEAIRGADAACVNCHQHSGLGLAEGSLLIPPVTGDYLFHPKAQQTSAPALPFVEGVHGNREPYTDETLVRAIREGLDSEGRPLSYLMPRYALGDEDAAALIAYLKALSVHRVPGVTDTVLHFATIITPDADPVKRAGVLDVLEHFFAEKNTFPLKPSPAMWTSGRTQYSKSMYMANRHWQLHVWELKGPAATWRAQLDRDLEAQPVFAVVSGLGGSDWSPVHEFCEARAVPCLLPNVELPVVAERDFYPMYFSRGVLLEAQLVARRILGPGDRPAPGVVEQVYRRGDVGQAAARALEGQLEGHGIAVHATVLPAGEPGRGLAAAIRRATQRRTAAGRALVLWLRPADLAGLGVVPAGADAIYLSGLMGGLEQSPVPAAWRERALMTYPFDLPERRGVRLDYPLGWFAFRHIPVVAEQVQTDTYLACNLLAEVLHGMADNFARPYLVEQLQAMLEHRLITGYYPHLALANNQRFASKGGYLVRFRDRRGTALASASDWTVP